MDVKVFVGVGGTTFVPRVPKIELYDPQGMPLGMVGGRKPSRFFSWQAGVSARVRSRKVFGEIGLAFSRFNFEVGEQLVIIAEAQGDPIDPRIVGNKANMNSLDLPIVAGYVPYANPYFKFFLYGGLVNKFNLRGFVEVDGGGSVKFRPKQIPGFPLVIYQAGARLGAAFDLGPLNFDFNYTIGMNSITKTTFRTNSQVLQLNIGWLF